LPAATLISGLARPAAALAEAARSALLRALADADGNISAAAKALGISRATLHRKVKEMSLDGPRQLPRVRNPGPSECRNLRHSTDSDRFLSADTAPK
jgi:transposase-like protein